MSTLYELGQDIKELESLLDRLEEAGDSEATGEVKEIKTTVQKLIQAKSEGLIAVVRANEMMIENIEAERKRLADLKIRKQARIDSIKKYALECMQAMEVKKIETHLGNMTVRKGTGKVVVDDFTKIPNEYKITKTEVKEDRTAIKKAIKEGLEIQGARLLFEDSLVMPKTKKE